MREVFEVISEHPIVALFVALVLLAILRLIVSPFQSRQ